MARQPTISIDCGIGAEAYKVVLSGKDLSAFLTTDQQPAFNNKKGEALVAAILSATAPGNIWCVTRLKGNKRNDGPAGEPAVQYFSQGGTVARHWHYKDDVRNDGAKGEPAYQCFDNNGKLLRVEHYKDGRSNDGAKGEPALQTFGGNGSLDYAYSYKSGVRVKRLSQDEIATYLKSVNGPAVRKAAARKAPKA